MGLDLSLIIYQMFKERGIMIRGLAHPMLFETKMEEDLQVFNLIPASLHKFHSCAQLSSTHDHICMINFVLKRTNTKFVHS